MADVEHSSLTDPDIHEPKGVTSAASGEVYIANGSGSGAWTAITAGNFEYADIYTLEGDAVTVGTIGTTAKTLPFSNAGPASGAVSDSANNRLTLTTAGVYCVTFNTTFSTVAAGDAGTYEFKVMDDGVATSLATAKEMSGSSDTDSVGVTGVISVGAGSQITVSVESDEAGDSDDILLYNAQLCAVLIKAT